ncbi:MAG: hypothetical protein IPP67_00325 [Rhodospirillaceae bacterium]|nr:hypothetical protein [Rhodospirillaceae bacterium]
MIDGIYRLIGTGKNFIPLWIVKIIKHLYESFEGSGCRRSGRYNEINRAHAGSNLLIFVKVGDQVEKIHPLLVLEAMKMEHTIRAPAEGRLPKFMPDRAIRSK